MAGRLGRLLRYSAVSLLCVVVHNAILIGFDRVGLHYLYACTVSFFATLLLAYFLHQSWTFASQRTVGSFLSYSLAMSINLPLSIGLIFLIHDLGELDMIAAAPLATIIQFGFNYLCASWTIGRTAHSVGSR